MMLTQLNSWWRVTHVEGLVVVGGAQFLAGWRKAEKPTDALSRRADELIVQNKMPATKVAWLQDWRKSLFCMYLCDFWA